MWATEHDGVEPDIMCIGKGLASGMPLAGIVARPRVMDWEPGGHGSTFGGNPVACAAAVATLELVESGLAANAADVGEHLLDALRLAATRRPCSQVRGRGLMIGIDVPSHDAAEAVEQACFERGLLVLTCGERTIRLAPPLVVTREQADVARRHPEGRAGSICHDAAVHRRPRRTDGQDPRRRRGRHPRRATCTARTPITGGSLGPAGTATADVDAAVERAGAAFTEWRATPAPVRGDLVRRLGELLRAHKDDLGELVSIEAGKIRSEGLGEVQEMIDICDFAVGLSRQLHGLTIASERPGHRMMETVAPAGPVRRHHRVQLPGRRLGVERHARPGVRRPGHLEAVATRRR